MPQNFNLFTGGPAVTVTSEYETHRRWPNLAPNICLNGEVSPLGAGMFFRLQHKPQFGAPQRYPQYVLAPHNNTTAYGTDDPTITGAACWNWALTGATESSPQRDEWVRSEDLIDLNTRTNADGRQRNALGLPRQSVPQFLNGAWFGLQTCYVINQAAIDAWLGLPQNTQPQIQNKMLAFVRLMCALKGLTLAGPGQNPPYLICCAFDARVVNYDHWGLAIRTAPNTLQSLQTVPGHGIWKSGSFPLEWGPPLHPGDRVVAAPVTGLTPTHHHRIFRLLAHDP